MKRLPVIGDFMKIDAAGNYHETGESVKDVLARLKVEDGKHEYKIQELKSKTPLLSVRNLQTYFPIKKGLFGKVTGEVKAVDEVSFDVYKGETLGLVGESGCGKTTLVSIVAGTLEPSAGDVIVLGQDLVAMSHGRKVRFRRDNVGFVFQTYNLLPALTAAENAAVPLLIAGCKSPMTPVPSVTSTRNSSAALRPVSSSICACAVMLRQASRKNARPNRIVRKKEASLNGGNV